MPTTKTEMKETEYYDDLIRTNATDFHVGDLVEHRASKRQAVICSVDKTEAGAGYEAVASTDFGQGELIIPEEVQLVDAGPARKRHERCLEMQILANESKKVVECQVTGLTFRPESASWEEQAEQAANEIFGKKGGLR